MRRGGIDFPISSREMMRVTVDEEVAEAPPAEPGESTTTELVARFAHDAAVLAVCEAQLAASRNKPLLRRAARDVVTGLAAIVALLTSLVFANVAMYLGLSRVVTDTAAALVLGAAWLVLGAVLLAGLATRLRQLRAGSRDLQQTRDEAEAAVRTSVERMATALSVELASAVVPMTSGAVLGAGDDVLDAAEELVDELAEVTPGGNVVAQMWSVVLLPGRWGLRAATTVLTPGRPER
jgi:hypothetical protein